MSKNTKIGIGILVVVVLTVAVFASQGELFKGAFKLKLPAKPRQAAQKQECKGLYHVVAPDGRCVWSCSEGTTPADPNSATAECKCKPGYTETGTDRFGRRVCSQTPAPQPVPPPPTPTPTPPPAEPPPAATSGLRVTGGIAQGHCNTSCVRSAYDHILQLEFTAEGSSLPQLRPALQANDEADNNVPGDNWVGSGTILVDSSTRWNIADGSASIRSYGYNHSLYFDFGDNADLSRFTKASFILIGTSTSTFRACSSLVVAGDSSDICQQSTPIIIDPSSKNVVHVQLEGLNANTRYIGVESLQQGNRSGYGIAATNIDNLRLYNDSITLHLAGSLLSQYSRSNDVKVEMIDASAQVRGVGYIKTAFPQPYASRADVVIIPGADIGNAPAGESPREAVSLASNQYKFVTSTYDLLYPDTTLAEALAVTVDLRSDIQWYDAHSAAGVNGAEGISPIAVNYSY